MENTENIENLKKKEKELVTHYDSNLEYYSSDALTIFNRTNTKVTGKTVLDLGCGDGRLCSQLQGYLFYTGVDYSGNRIEKASESNKDNSATEFVKSGIMEYLDTCVEVGDKHDICCMFEVLEHLAEPKAILDKVRKITGMYICGSVPINHPYVAHLQVYEKIDDIVELIGADAIFTVSEGHVFFRIDCS